MNVSEAQEAQEEKAITWILVADGYSGRIYSSEGPGRGIRPAQDQDLNAGALRYTPANMSDTVRTLQVAANANGRTSRRACMLKTQQEKFARSVATVLERGLDEKRYDRLVIVAPPQALGDLRGALPSAVRSCVTSEISRDLTHASCFELPKFLGPSIAG